MPSPHRGCDCYIFCNNKKKSGISLPILLYFSWNSRLREETSLDFRCLCELFWKSAWKQRSLSKNTWKSRAFFTKRSGNPTSTVEEGIFFWNSPLNHTLIALWSLCIILVDNNIAATVWFKSLQLAKIESWFPGKLNNIMLLLQNV